MVGVVVAQVPAAAQNLATNPGFENGNTSGWSPFGPPTISVQSTQVHSGTYAALVQGRTSTWNGIAQSMSSVMQAGQLYSVSAFVRLPSGPNQTLQLTIKKTDAGGDQYSAVASGSVSSNGWLQLSGQYTLNISGSLTGLTLYVEMPSSATADYLIDDLSVTLNQTTPIGGTNGAVTVYWNDVHQKIEGFGASSAWRSTWNTAVADMFFSTNTGLGLSLLRTRITPTVGTVENSIMQMARDRGARVWSAPWSPPTNYKTANQGGVISVNGGGFNGTPANYQGYANQLAAYVVNMKNTYGVSLYALSMQNEPDYNTTNYESCVWNGQQIHDFVPYLSAALTASNVSGTKVIIPESESWGSGPGLYNTAMNDPAVAPLVSVLANHNYVGDNTAGDQNPPAVLPKYGKSLWETEVSTFGATFDGGITNGIYWARRIHSFLTIPEVNAWHYWWLSASGADNAGLASNSDVLAKRGYVLGQYSRFVRPNYSRVGVVTNSGPAMVSAYKEPLTGKFAIVAVNPASGTVTQTFTLNNFSSPTSVTPWVTSATASLAVQSSVAVSASEFTYQLPAMSVVTFVGQAGVTTPSLNLQISGGGLGATLNGEAGPTYNVQASTNFSNWQTVLSTNPTTLPVTVMLPAVSAPQQFYRVQLTP